MAHHPRHHYRLAAALRDAGYDARTLSQPDLTTGHEDAVPVHELPVRDGRLARMASGPVTMWHALRLKPDAIHVVSLDLLPWAVLTRLVTRRPVVYDSNEEYDTYMLIKEWIPPRLRPLLQRLVRRIEPWLAARLDAATTALPATQEKFAAAGVNAVQVRNFPPLGSLAEGGPRTGPYSYDVLVGGSLPDDQLPLLAETAARLRKRVPGVRWLVVARNYGDRERALLERALADQGVRDDFELQYNAPFLRMRELMASSRIAFVLYGADANYSARIPIRIFEYMAAAVPFVAPDTPVIRQFCADRGVAWLAEAGSPESYADTLARLLEDERAQLEMSEKGPALARTEYSWEHESARLVGLYGDLIGAPAAEPAIVEVAA